jgi:hypothetical protein
MKIKKKSYWQLAVFTLIFVLVPIILVGIFGDALPEAYATKLTLAYFFLCIAGLMAYMTRTGRAYWINGGPSYEQTVAEPARAYLFLVRHLIPFGIAAILFCIAMIPCLLLKTAWYIDVPLFVILLIGAALSTVRVRF